jgi:hypothetical protein
MENIGNIIRKGRVICIHGTPYENIESMLKEENYHVIGHFFVIDDFERCIPKKDFYNKLIPTIDIAFSYSRQKAKYERGKIYIEKPLAIMCVSYKGELELENRRKSSPYSCYFGDSFSVIHDPCKRNSDVFSLINDYNDLEEINNEFGKYCSKKKIVKDEPRLDMSAFIFWMRRNAEKMIKKLNKKIGELNNDRT